MQHDKNCRNRESGVSEVIGAVLLIALVVAAVAIVGVGLLSQPLPKQIPALDAIISTSGNIIQITHNGGDTLQREDFRILVDGVDNTSSFNKDGAITWQSWSPGESLTFPYSNPNDVRIVYTGAGASAVLSSAIFGVPGIPTSVPTTITTPTITYTITASTGTGGRISPSGMVSVADGDSQTFIITPEAGYSVADVVADGVSQGAIFSYTFTNVHAGHSISATFASTLHTITASASSGGNITPSGAVSIADGLSQTFTIIPDAGKSIVNVTVDGAPVDAVASYTFTNVVADHTIIVSFTTITHTITASTGTGGSISPPGVVVIPEGSSQTFTVTPLTGYHVTNVLVDGVSQGAILSYTFPNVMTDHSISASFAINTYNITASATSGGTITPDGDIGVDYGASQAFTITPNAGKSIVAVMVDGVNTGTISSYTFTNIDANHTIAASFIGVKYTITASAGTGGTIAPSGSVDVFYGTDQVFAITPDTGYYIADVLVDGISVGKVSSYTFTNVIAPHTIAASFALNPVITASAGANGAISPSGSVSVVYGNSQTFNIVPNSGYSIQMVTIDGVSQGAISSYTFTNVLAAHTISATFAINTYTITASAGTGGSITPSGSVSVNHGSSQTFNIAPNSGYSIQTVTVNGVSQGALSSYTFTNVQANGNTIVATFAINTYTITASAGTGGSISPSGSVSVNQGSSQTFNIAPNSGYSIQTVTVDGVSQGAISSYTFTNVQSAHTIVATFAINTYTITASAGSGGSISPSGSVSVNQGSSQTFNIAPNSGYSIQTVTVDGVSQGAISSYTFTNVQASHTISATFAINTYMITASAGSGGSISPSGGVSVNYGSSQTFNIAPNSGYSIQTVTVDGVSQGTISSYTFTNVQASHTISATFAINTYTITASAGSGGSISPSGAVSVNYGASQTFTITPNSGYIIGTVTVNGVSQGAISSYTFNNVQANGNTISATFISTSFTISESWSPGGLGYISISVPTQLANPGTVQVPTGNSQTFYFVPATQKAVFTYQIDGGAVVSPATAKDVTVTYTFNNVRATHTIVVVFK